MELTKADQKLLKRMERAEKMRAVNYIAIGIALGSAVFLFMFGYIFNEKSGYVAGFYIGTIALLLLVSLHTRDRLYEIIKKLQGKQ
jgi:hypothetical protein